MTFLVSQSASNISSSSTVTASFSSVPSMGNLLVALTMNRSPANAVPSLSSGGAGGSNNWNAAVTIGFADGTMGDLGIFYRIAVPSEPLAVTAATPSANLFDLHIFDVGGAVPSTGLVLDATATAPDDGTRVTSRATGTTGTLAQANEICFAGVAQEAANGGTAAAPWTNGFGNGLTTARLMSSYAIVASTAPEDSVATWGTARRATGAISTFKGT